MFGWRRGGLEGGAFFVGVLGGGLAVVGVGAVFAEVVFVEDVLGERGEVGVEEEGIEGDAGAHFEGDAVVEGVLGGGAPGEGGVVVLEDGGEVEGVEVLLAEGIGDGVAGVGFVVVGDFCGGEGAAEGDGAVEVVGVSGAEAGEGATGLGPAGGGGAVGVADAANAGEGAVEDEVGGGVRGGAEGSCDLAAGGDLKGDEVFFAEAMLGDAAGFDDHEAALGVEAADVAPGEADEAGGGELAIGGEDLLFERGGHGGTGKSGGEGFVAQLEEVLHDVAEGGLGLRGAEGVVELAVEGVEAGVAGVVGGDGMVDGVAEGAEGGLGLGDGVVASGGGTGGDGGEEGGAEGAGLVAAADLDGAAEDVGVDLHEGGVFDGEASGGDDFANGDAVGFEALDDGEGTEGGGFDEGAVDFVGGGVEGLAEDEAGEAGVGEDGAVAVVPVEGEEAGLAGLEGGEGGLHGLEFGVGGGAVGIGDEVVDEPEEEVADGALAGFEAEVAGEDGAVDDAAEAGDVGEGLGGGVDHQVAGAGAEDLDEGAGADAGADGAHVGIEGPDGDGDAGAEAEFFGPGGAEVAGGLVGGEGGGVEAGAEVGEGGVELGEEVGVGEAAPVGVEEGFVAGGADAARGGEGVGEAAEDGGEVVAVFEEGVGGGEDFGGGALEVEDFAPEPFGRVGAAALGEVVGADSGGEGGDFGGFGVGGVVAPEPDVGGEVIFESGEEGEGGVVGVDGDDGAAGGIDADGDDVGGVE